jgi:hypothetical protein
MNTFIFSENMKLCKAYIPFPKGEEFKDRTHLKVSLEYTLGGMNYFSGNQYPRGYRISITPVSRSEGMESFTMLGNRRSSGGYVMIEEATRYNKKRLIELAKQFEPKLQEIFDAYIADDVTKLRETIVNRDVKPVAQKAPVNPLKMKPLTKEVLDAFVKQGDTSNRDPKDTKIIAKFFTPDGPASWYATEYNPETRTFFGWANLGDDTCAELGNFSLDELEQLRGRMNLPVERDRHFGNHTLQEVMDFKVR